MTRLSPARALVLGIAIAICAIAAFVAIGVHRRNVEDATATYAGTPVEPPRPAADFTLTGGDGHAARVLAPDGELEFLFFGYTHCPDECPLAMASLGRAYRKLPEATRARTRVVFVSVDPARDTPAVVGRYATGFDPHFIGLTGTPAQLAPVWRAYGIQIDAKTKEIGHGDAIYAIDAHRNVVLIYPPDVAANDLTSDATRLAR